MILKKDSGLRCLTAYHHAFEQTSITPWDIKSYRGKQSHISTYTLDTTDLRVEYSVHEESRKSIRCTR